MAVNKARQPWGACSSSERSLCRASSGLVIVGSSNAVNLTDGLDGLAIGCTITVAFAYALFSYAAGNFRIAEYLQVPFYPFAGELTVVCSALVGAGLGFLWFNCHPAK